MHEILDKILSRLCSRLLPLGVQVTRDEMTFRFSLKLRDGRELRYSRQLNSWSLMQMRESENYWVKFLSSETLDQVMELLDTR